MLFQVKVIFLDFFYFPHFEGISTKKTPRTQVTITGFTLQDDGFCNEGADLLGIDWLYTLQERR